MTLRLAIIGAGIMGADHARIVAEELPGAALQVICDASAERAKAVAEAHGAADMATDPEAVIARKDVDAVLIASPDETHAPLSLACIAAGKPVLCEKPLSSSPAACVEVMEAEMAAGRRLVQLGFMRRFDPSYAEMRAARGPGGIGRALMMHNFHRNVDSPGSWFTGPMAITNSASHEFDVIRFVLGTDYVSVSAFQPERSDDMVAPVVMVLETADGQLATIEINNNAAYGYDVRGELVGEAGSVMMSAPVYATYNSQLAHAERYAADWRRRYAEAYRLQNRAFLDFAATGRPSEIAASAWDGYAAAVAGEAGVAALRSGQRAAVAMMAKPDFYS
ncbi:Gfo/Idh/MocA family oxidoreductase [Poseidonocella sp. HB161398]|uniref:Gfo/Idh/MocA family oxidoreductase n=1 Tax=Poseidonocella sp. HB161398 TaxID=2320855 RepID=UPI001109E6C1|nr:Gfo/Idh/MocA family oxidoreductase [Poseidonocella sp. HB161398]